MHGDHAAVAARPERRADLFALPADPPEDRRSSCRCRSTSAAAEAGTIVWRDPDDRRALRDAGHRRPRQAAMEARLGHALGRARRRLRDGRQGPDRLRASSRARSPGRSAAQPPEGFNYELFLDEQGPEDLEVEGQRPDHRRMAALRHAREPRACSCTTSRARPSGCIFDVIPRQVDDYLTFLEKYPGPGREGAARQPGLAHPCAASRRRRSS